MWLDLKVVFSWSFSGTYVPSILVDVTSTHYCKVILKREGIPWGWDAKRLKCLHPEVSAHFIEQHPCYFLTKMQVWIKSFDWVPLPNNSSL
jgi:hypothetical protein